MHAPMQMWIGLFQRFVFTESISFTRRTRFRGTVAIFTKKRVENTEVIVMGISFEFPTQKENFIHVLAMFSFLPWRIA
jgi:hypothetical protein